LIPGYLAVTGVGPALAATLIAIAGAVVGIWLTGAHRHSRVVVPFSAGVLLGVALFFLMPELVAENGLGKSLLLFAGGYLLLLVINRYAYPVCPTCSHDHDHNSCATVLHGFAAPLITASAAHSFFDGWGIATAGEATTVGIRVGVPLALALHKIPEGIALGAILRVAVKSRVSALGWCALAEGVTVAGGLVGAVLTPHLGNRWIGYPLGLAAGCFLYLAFHAVHEEWKRRGPWPAFVPALTGAAGAAALERGVHALLR